jgi:hypothetical protein
MDGILDIMKQIALVLKKDGFFCITDLLKIVERTI